MQGSERGNSDTRPGARARLVAVAILLRAHGAVAAHNPATIIEPFADGGLCRTSSSIVDNVRVRSGVMVRGFVAFILTVMLAMHAATPSRACTTDETHAVSADTSSPGTLGAFDLSETGGAASNQIDPHHHNAPCQDHCNWFASISFHGFLPPEPGADIELSHLMLPALLAVAVPPPQ